MKEERKVILTLVKKGLEPVSRLLGQRRPTRRRSRRVNEIRAAIDEVKDRRSVTIQEYSAEILDELAQASLELSSLSRRSMSRPISQIVA